MSHGRNKHQSRESRALVRTLFWREWDPIGIASPDETDDEYDTYVDKAYVMLMDDRATAQEIAAYLLDIATRYMGLPHSALLVERSERTAKMLITMRPEFETH